MSKIQLKREDLHTCGSGYEKYFTNVVGVFIYHVQKGLGLSNCIISEQNKPESSIFGEKSVILIYSYYSNGRICGLIEGITYTRGLKDKYTLGEVFHQGNIHSYSHYIL